MQLLHMPELHSAARSKFIRLTMCKGKINKVMIGGVSVVILVSTILVIWFMMRTGGQKNEAESQIIKNKNALIEMELNDNEMGASSSNTACISAIVGLILLATLLKSAIMFYCCRKKMVERKEKAERKKIEKAELADLKFEVENMKKEKRTVENDRLAAKMNM